MTDLAMPAGIAVTVRNVMPCSDENEPEQIAAVTFLRRSTEAEIAAHREAILASGRVTRMVVADGIVPLAVLKDDPLWEKDFITDNWIRRTPEFVSARAEAEALLPAQCEAAVIALGVALLGLEDVLPHQEDGPPHPAIWGVGAYDEVMSWDVSKFVTERTSGEAIKVWRDGMLAYRATHDGDTLWWRWRPEIEGCVPFGETEPRWKVYSCLVIGNNADTLIERLKRGAFQPNKNMIEDHLITVAQLEAIGWVCDELGWWTHPDFPNAEFY